MWFLGWEESLGGFLVVVLEVSLKFMFIFIFFRRNGVFFGNFYRFGGCFFRIRGCDWIGFIFIS